MRLHPRRTLQDRLAYGGIFGSALVCLVLLAWSHLGVGALVVPPQSAKTQVHTVGPLTVSLQVGAAGLTAAGPNTLAYTIRDAQGHALDVASMQIHPQMIGMAMDGPTVTATANAQGAYIAHPRFGMAGDWQLVATITPRGGIAQRASFKVGVRWK